MKTYLTRPLWGCLCALALGACSSGSDDPVQFAENQAPTVGVVADQSIPAGSANAVFNFTVDDDQNGANALTVNASSDNQALVPDSALALSGDGAQRTLTVTPVAGVAGTANITVTVVDSSGAQSTRSFALTVEPAEEMALSFSQFLRQVFPMDANSQPLEFNDLEFIDDGADDDFGDLLQ